jgi:hypothetical protein
MRRSDSSCFSGLGQAGTMGISVGEIMKPYTIALAGLTLSLTIASWGSRKDGEARRDVIAMVFFAVASLAATIASVYL